MMHFGAFVPNVSWEVSESSMTEGCEVGEGSSIPETFFLVWGDLFRATDARPNASAWPTSSGLRPWALESCRYRGMVVEISFFHDDQTILIRSAYRE